MNLGVEDCCSLKVRLPIRELMLQQSQPVATQLSETKREKRHELRLTASENCQWAEPRKISAISTKK